MDSFEYVAEVTFCWGIHNIMRFINVYWLFFDWFFRQIRFAIHFLDNFSLPYRFFIFFLLWDLNLGFGCFLFLGEIFIAPKTDFLSFSWFHDWSIAICVIKNVPLQLSFNIVQPCNNFCPIFLETSFVLLRAKLSFWLRKKSSFSLSDSSTLAIVCCWTFYFLA